MCPSCPTWPTSRCRRATADGRICRQHLALDSAPASEQPEVAEAADPREDDGPVHRRLIRATFPRPEGHVPERREPEFTIRQPGGRGRGEVDGNRAGYRSTSRNQRHGQPGGRATSAPASTAGASAPTTSVASGRPVRGGDNGRVAAARIAGRVSGGAGRKGGR